MSDYLNISEDRRKEIEETVDLLLPSEVSGSHETDVGFNSYCETLSGSEKLFALRRGSNRGLKNVVKQTS
jgi:hypothetical protein